MTEVPKGNTKHKAPNPKQIQRTNDQMTKICLVDLVSLIHLVCLVNEMNEKNQIDQTNQIDQETK